MTNNDGFLNAQQSQCRMEHICLSSRSPEPIARTRAVTETGPIECNHTVVARQLTRKPTGLEISERDTVSVNQHDGRTLAALDVVKTRVPHVDELPAWRVLAFCTTGSGLDPQGRGRGADGNSTRKQTCG